MRHLSLAALALALISVTASAQTPTPAPANPNALTGQRFGSITCTQKIPCPDTNEIPADLLATNANNCLTTGLGLALQGGFFDDVAGLDANNCLQLKSGIATSDPKQILPRCCVITVSSNVCTFHCDMLSRQ